MKQFATYEEENIHYWTNRASGYSTVNQEELASDQKTVCNLRQNCCTIPG